MYQAILHHALHFNAVQIDASLSSGDDRIKEGRGLLADYVKRLSGEELRDEHPFRFTAHLPYPHQRGEYFGAVQSDSVLFMQKYDERKPFAFLAVDLSGGYGPMSNNKVPLSLDEIKPDGVRLVLVPDSDFSPHWRDWNRDLDKSPSELEHYAIFKGFKGAARGEAGEVAAKIAGAGIGGRYALANRIKPLIEKIWLPEHTKPQLLTYSHGRLDGMAIVDVGDELTLYEFPFGLDVNHELKKLFGHYKRVAVADLVSRHNQQPFPADYVQTYTGHSAVKRINEASVEALKIRS